MVNKDIVRPLR